MSDALRTTVLLSTQRAALGLITSNIRGITTQWDDASILLKAIYDSPVTNEDRERLEEMAAEIAADFPNHAVKTDFVHADTSKRLSGYALTEWVYMRYEVEA